MIEKYIGANWGIEGWFDSSDQTKTAAFKPETFVPPEMEEAIATLKGREADKRFVHIHIVALTDGDFYGPNLNGDIFDTAELTGTQAPSEMAKNMGKFKGQAVPRYKTFEEGKFHRNHANSASDPAYGDILCSAWNDVMRRVELLVRIAKQAIPELGMSSGADILNKLDKRGFLTTSMGCWENPDTLIRVRDGYKAIKDIKVGDDVYTHEGNWKPVTQLHQRKWSGEIRHIRASGFPLPLSMTSDHPMYATALSAHSRGNGRSDHALRLLMAGQSTIKDKDITTGWMHAAHLNEGDAFYVLPVTYEATKYTQIGSEPLARLMGFYLAEGSVMGGNQAQGALPLATQFSCCLTDDLPQVLPGLVHECFPSVTCSMAPHSTSVVGLTVNVFSADMARFFCRYVGRRGENKRICPELFVADTSVKLAFLGAWCAGDGHVDIKGVHWSSANLSLILQGRDLLLSLDIVSSIYRIVHKAGIGFNHHETTEFTLNIPLAAAVPLIPYAERKLAGLEAMVAAHPGARGLDNRRLGKHVVHRIKSVEDVKVENITVYNIEVADDESYSAYGFVSHNCRISHEKCTICGHENEFVPERCSHLKDRMNEVMPDGRKVAARNFGLRFFEQSEVGIPADPGAYSMSKVASQTMPAVNVAKDVVAPWGVKVSDIEKHSPVADPISGTGLDHECKIIEVIDPADHYTPAEVKAAMLAAGDLTTLLSTAASAGIVFSPIELALATTYAEPEKIADDRFDGFGRLTVDKFSADAYSVLRTKIAARSGFLAPLVATGWEPSKIAHQGADGLASYYAAYRSALSSLPRASFIKAAQRNPHLRDVAAAGDVTRAMSYLTYAGLL